jgi:hypothetical protein
MATKSKAKSAAKPKPKAEDKGKADDKWLQGAVRPGHEGEFTAKAKAARMSVQEYANWCLREGSKCDATTKRQAIFARNAGRISKDNAAE